ncbi:hypothetical protein GCM10027299_21310 [Larkinella ripae]
MKDDMSKENVFTLADQCAGWVNKRIVGNMSDSAFNMNHDYIKSGMLIFLEKLLEAQQPQQHHEPTRD